MINAFTCCPMHSTRLSLPLYFQNIDQVHSIKNTGSHCTILYVHIFLFHTAYMLFKRIECILHPLWAQVSFQCIIPNALSQRVHACIYGKVYHARFLPRQMFVYLQIFHTRYKTHCYNAHVDYTCMQVTVCQKHIKNINVAINLFFEHYY